MIISNLCLRKNLGESMITVEKQIDHKNLQNVYIIRVPHQDLELEGLDRTALDEPGNIVDVLQNLLIIVYNQLPPPPQDTSLPSI